jgi:hypothetical protein
MRNLTDLLRDEYGLGASIGNLDLFMAYDISDDGRTIVGATSGPNGQQPWIAYLGTPIQPPGTWFTDTDGNWSVAGNWSPTVPNSQGAQASFLDAITQPRTVTVDGAITVGRIDFDHEIAYTIAGPNAITLDANHADAQLNVLTGSHTISAPVTLSDNATINVIPAASSLAITGSFDSMGKTITKTGAGSLTLNNLRAAELKLNGGTVGITSGGIIAATSVLNTLTIAGGPAPTAKLDVNVNAVVIDYSGTSPAATIRQQIIAGRGGSGLGKIWNGNGITSSAAANANATQPDSRSVGYAENSALPLGPYTNFRGQPVDSTSILIAFTRTGDANLDGLVNDDDVTIVGATYAPGVPNASWALGDFDYNGFVDDDDVTLLGAFYDPSAPPLIVAVPASSVAAVPEPGTSVLLLSALFSIALFAIRRCLLSRSERAT